jgi:hypothetical protein
VNKSILLSICDAIPVLWHHVSIKTLEMFDRQLWSYSLEFFRGEISDDQFEADFIAAIENQLTRAWNEGADEVGVLPEEMTADDLAILEGIINDEIGYLTGLAVDIIDIKEDGASIEEFRSKFRPRIDIWASKYNEVKIKSSMHFNGKVRRKWVLGATEKHCPSCSALNGIVAFAYEWEQAGITPGESGSSVLSCGGWNCDCKLPETDERRSPNAFQRLLDIATMGNV